MPVSKPICFDCPICMRCGDKMYYSDVMCFSRCPYFRVNGKPSKIRARNCIACAPVVLSRLMSYRNSIGRTTSVAERTIAANKLMDGFGIGF